MAKGQKKVLPDDPSIFADSVSTLFQATGSNSAIEVGDGFSAIWSQIGTTHQSKIISQMLAMEERGLKLKPYQQAYCAVLVSAIQIEGADTQKIEGYLNTTEKVMQTYAEKKLLQYLRFSASFFLHKALHVEQSNRLYVVDADYQFKFIQPTVLEEEVEDSEGEDSDEGDDWFESMDDEYEDDEWDTEWDDYEDQTYEEEASSDVEPEEEATPMVELPVIEGPIISFTSLTMNFATSYDSVFLQNTGGDYLILSDDFVGKGGKFDWAAAGLGADSVFVHLNDYTFKPTYAQLNAENSTLTYLGKLAQPVDGVFEFKSVKHDSTTDARYPRFMSYYSNIKIDRRDDGFIYTGGFALDGAKIKSTSVLGGYSKIETFDDTYWKFRAKAKVFEFQDSLIRTERASIVIYQGADSIYHPAVRLTYDIKNKKLTVEKDKGGFKDTPYSSSYFNLDFTSDIIRWDLTADSLDVSILQARNIVPAYFESASHYNLDDYRSLGDKVYPFNPLSLVMAYFNKTRLKEFYVDELAKFHNKDKIIIRGAMIGLAEKGLIGFDSQSNLITIKPKSRHMYNAKRGSKDFDNIILKSVTSEKPNATLNFSSNELTVRGVDGFKISDSLNVIIRPDSSEITFLKDRNFIFDGRVFAGNFEYLGKDFTFKYDSFLIHLNKIDSIQFFAKAENSRDNSGKNRKASNTLQGTSGTLYINHPRNKSAKVKYANYPRFKSGQGGAVYFDREKVLDGAYDKSVYFSIPPFDLDSLDGADASNVVFDGTFMSSGIFPDFEEKMSMQEDLSLGFEHQVPPEGYQLYEGDGVFYNELKMDEGGIRGNGRIDYLTTSLESENFVFYPDSVTGSGQHFKIREETYNGVTFPGATAENYNVRWHPKQDNMYVENIGTPFQFYNETASLDGTTILSKTGVKAQGILETRGSKLKSRDITLNPESFYARNSKFQLESDNPKKPALFGDNVEIDFKLTDNYAIIRPEVEGQAAIGFPYSQFKTSITEARWDLQEEKVTMTKPDDVPLENSYFYTTREELDSLTFMAEKAVYDINTLELKVSGIPYIIVADAKITPENNEVLVLENAKIGRLTNTTIVLDTLNGYHRLTEGVIDIESRNSFSGYATYQFVDSRQDTIPIKMENFRLEQVAVPNARKKDEQYTLHTAANGSVPESQNLLIAQGIFYKGDMILYAHQPAMELDGYVKLDMESTNNNDWIQYTSSADQTEILIDYDNAITESDKKLEAGLFISSADNSLYSTFASEKYSPDDDNFFVPRGHLFFDKVRQKYVIADTAKVNGRAFEGQIFRYDDKTTNIQFEGKVNFLPKSKDVQILSAAIGIGNVNELTFEMNTMMAITFEPIPGQAFDIMAYDVLDVIKNLGAPEALGDPTELLYKLADIAGEQVAKSYEQESLKSYVALADFAKETSKSLVFTDIDMKWSAEHNAFYSTGKLGLSNIFDIDLNGAFDGFLEIRRTEDGIPVLNLFIKASPDSWYFFSYEDNRLLLFSSNNDFNELIGSKSNGAKAKMGELVFAPADKVETLSFINRFRLQYLGIDDLYELDAEVEEEEPEEVEDGFGGTDDEDDGFEDDDDGF